MQISAKWILGDLMPLAMATALKPSILIIISGCQYHPTYIPYSWKLLRYVYFTVESLIRIFADKILQMTYNEASFQLKMMLSSEFPHTKFSLLIDHSRKLQKFHTMKISGYTVLYLTPSVGIPIDMMFLLYNPTESGYYDALYIHSEGIQSK